MNIRQHAFLARTLQDNCGGVDQCVTILEDTPFAMGRTAMYACRESSACKTMPIGAVYLLEQHCGHCSYSQALLQAGPAPTDAECAISEACEASELMAQAQGMIRRAGEDHVYTENEKREIEPMLQRVEAHLRSVRTAMEGGL